MRRSSLLLPLAFFIAIPSLAEPPPPGSRAAQTERTTRTATAQPAGQLRPPVAGAISGRWGRQTEGGPATNIVFRNAGPAIISSPCAGRVVFAEPFRSYGMLLILDCGGGYHAVLSGFDQLNTQTGQTVRIGMPVGGLKRAGQAVARDRLAVTFELRRDGRPINPTPWLRSSRQ